MKKSKSIEEIIKEASKDWPQHKKDKIEPITMCSKINRLFIALKNRLKYAILRRFLWK